MPNLKSKLQNLFERVEDWSDERRYRNKQYDSSLLIKPYIGFGSSEKVIIKGRVLVDEQFRPSNQTDSRWRNLKNMYRLFETDEVPNARVKAGFQDAKTEVTADREGYFDAVLNPTNFESSALWHEVELKLLEPVIEDEVTAKGHILIPPDTAKFGVISDIDDTVMETNVASKLKMLLTTILSNEHTRIPFEGVAAFYRALQRGAGGE